MSNTNKVLKQEFTNTDILATIAAENKTTAADIAIKHFNFHVFDKNFIEFFIDENKKSSNSFAFRMDNIVFFEITKSENCINSDTFKKDFTTFSKISDKKAVKRIITNYVDANNNTSIKSFVPTFGTCNIKSKKTFVEFSSMGIDVFKFWLNDKKSYFGKSLIRDCNNITSIDEKFDGLYKYFCNCNSNNFDVEECKKRIISIMKDFIKVTSFNGDCTINCNVSMDNFKLDKQDVLALSPFKISSLGGKIANIKTDKEIRFKTNLLNLICTNILHMCLSVEVENDSPFDFYQYYKNNIGSDLKEKFNQNVKGKIVQLIQRITTNRIKNNDVFNAQKHNYYLNTLLCDIEIKDFFDSLEYGKIKKTFNDIYSSKELEGFTDSEKIKKATQKTVNSILQEIA